MEEINMIIWNKNLDATRPMATRRDDDIDATPIESGWEILGAAVVVATIFFMVGVAMWKGIAFVAGLWLVCAALWAILVSTEQDAWRGTISICCGIVGLGIGLVMMGVC